MTIETKLLPPVGHRWEEQRGVYLGITPAEGALPARHLVALDATPRKKLNWQASKDWAHALGNGARLPTQLEAMLAWTLAPKAFKPTYHWTSTQDSSGGAFVQDFEYGNSHWGTKGYEHVVVPFRALDLHTFQPLEV